ncbi:MAG: hypothetical protein DIU70_006615 [Bacillota bacterium]
MGFRPIATALLVAGAAVAAVVAGFLGVGAVLTVVAAPTAEPGSVRQVLVTSVPVAPSAPVCRPEESASGLCLETLPRLYCCSAAYLGWSQITVGDRLPLAGAVAQDPDAPHPTTALRLVYPSGRTVEIPVGPDGSFHQEIAYDEEGHYRLYRANPDRRWVADLPLASFAVPYRAEVLSHPLEADRFRQPRRPDLTLAAVPHGPEVRLRVRFTDAAGRPAAGRTLALADGRAIWTDAAGVAEIPFVPRPDGPGYELVRLYPGLGVLTYREIRVGAGGEVQGLPGGPVRGVRVGDTWVFPLREFLVRAAPALVPSGQELAWEERTRSVRFGDTRLQLDTGVFLGPEAVFRVRPHLVDGRVHLSLGDLARLLQAWGAWAEVEADGTLRLAAPALP